MSFYDQDKKLSIAYWLSTNAEKIKKIAKAIFIFLDGVLILYLLITIIILLVSIPNYKDTLVNLSQNYINFELWKQRNHPQDLKTTGFQVVEYAGQGECDLIAQVENLNSKWAVKSFDYRFIYQGGVTQYQQGFILPQEKKIVAIFNHRFQAKIINPQLEITNIIWQRIDNQKSLWQIKSSDFIIDDIEYLNNKSVENLDISRVKFSLRNNTLYGFYDLEIKVILYQSGRVVGINSLTVSQLMSGEKKNLEMAFNENLPLVVQVVVQPEVNILDSHNVVSF
ncbi:MAG: hypothetical protein PHS07_00990 [Patescibacteria group bacterium]|nr:hypothetical protein [Patescibacteria group bacterium]